MFKTVKLFIFDAMVRAVVNETIYYVLFILFSVTL